MRNFSISKSIKIKYCFLIPFLLAFTSDSLISTYTIPIAARSVASADLDLDGDMDIVVGHLTMWQATNKTISVLKNTDNGNFVIADTSKCFWGYQENIFACKIDSDDYPDLVTFYFDFPGGVTQRYIRIWYNENGNFNIYKDFTLNSSERFDDITYGDVNGDNLIDILVMSNLKQTWGVLYNLGNGLLSAPEYHVVTGYYPQDIQCGDLNGDDRDDVVITGQIIEIFYSRISGFESKILDQQAFKDKAAIIDFNRDGVADIVADANSAVVSSKWTNIYKNTGNETFVKLEDHISITGAGYFSLMDYNNDTLHDIAYLLNYPDTTGTGITDTIGGIEIFYNLGNFQLSDPQFIPLDNYHEGWRNFHTADFDGNGYNDFAIVRTSYYPLENNLEFLFNDGNGHFVQNPLSIDEFYDKNDVASLRCYPNPFTEYTNFEYEIQKTALVELSVYDLQGMFIQCITHQTQKGGHYSIQWRGLAKAANQHKPRALIAYLKVNGQICQSVKLINY